MREESLEQRGGGSDFVPRAIPEEPPLALWAVEFRIAAYEAKFRVMHFGDIASTKLDLASLALLHELTAGHAVDDRDEFPSVACWTFAPFAKNHA